MYSQKTWDEANSDCTCTNKARLVDIRTDKEQAFVKNLTGGVSAWIGARDNIIEGTWTWSVDDSTLKSNSYNKWTGAKYPVAGGQNLILQVIKLFH